MAYFIPARIILQFRKLDLIAWEFRNIICKKVNFFLNRFAILKAPFQICNADTSETLYWQVLKFNNVNLVLLGTFLSATTIVSTVFYFRISEKGTKRRLCCTCASFFLLFSLENEILTAVQVLEFIQCCQLP